jgi:PPOX class probable F420-dependent enzyme
MRLDPDACLSRFAAARVARLATASADGRPHLVPVTFALVGERVVTAVDQKPKATTRLRRLRNIAENPVVSVLADRYDDDWRTLWWVRADGTATVYVGPSTGPDRSEAVEALVSKYPQYRREPPGGPVIAVDVSSWSGWSYR